MIKKINILILFLSLSMIGFSQTEDKKCGQLPHVNPTIKAVCSNDVQSILSENLPVSFKKDSKHESTFKMIIDCFGRIDMVIYKNGNLTKAEQKHFLLQINKLKDWTSGQVDGKDVKTTVYITVDVVNRTVIYKVY
jgi:hypothetical protein